MPLSRHFSERFNEPWIGVTVVRNSIRIYAVKQEKGDVQVSERRNRVFALSGIAALGLASLIGAGTAAHAAPQDFGNIDGDRLGSLTVHKFLHQSGTAEGDISEAPAPGDFSDPVADVIFTAYPVLDGSTPVDLTVTENWNDLADLNPGPACTAPTGYTLGPGIELPATEADGTAFTNLEVGLYQVCETAAPAHIVDRALPFILTVPMPHENGWVYDVNAYPKNGAGVIEKTIEPQQDTGLGAVIEFPVTVPVPTMQSEWTGFAIRDVLDTRLEPLDAADIAVLVDGGPLDTSFYSIDIDGQQITMDFTGAGLAWLNEGPNAHVGESITVVFAGTIVAVGDGAITNQAELWTNNPGFDPDEQPPLESPVVTTYWGSLEVLKRAAETDGSQGVLEGAVFEIYNAADPYAADCSTQTAAGDPIAVNGATEFTSNDLGIISIAGLFVSDSVNAPVDALERCYVLQEIAAPAGYVLPDNPFTGVTVTVGETTTAENGEIVNTQQEVPELPITGAAGQAALIIGGAAMGAIAIGLVLLNRRSTTKE